VLTDLAAHDVPLMGITDFMNRRPTADRLTTCPLGVIIVSYV
jgi:hypothetical protein